MGCTNAFEMALKAFSVGLKLSTYAAAFCCNTSRNACTSARSTSSSARCSDRNLAFGLNVCIARSCCRLSMSMRRSSSSTSRSLRYMTSPRWRYCSRKRSLCSWNAATRVCSSERCIATTLASTAWHAWRTTSCIMCPSSSSASQLSSDCLSTCSCSSAKEAKYVMSQRRRSSRSTIRVRRSTSSRRSTASSCSCFSSWIICSQHSFCFAALRARAWSLACFASRNAPRASSWSLSARDIWSRIFAKSLDSTSRFASVFARSSLAFSTVTPRMRVVSLWRTVRVPSSMFVMTRNLCVTRSATPSSSMMRSRVSSSPFAVSPASAAARCACCSRASSCVRRSTSATSSASGSSIGRHLTSCSSACRTGPVTGSHPSDSMRAACTRRPARFRTSSAPAM
mmetsp:Transcript_53340/g.164079  ORF Transcript_53340/g.164079 Transcript_53340/m.164079 type:complete len:397 (-) Transcript_53340:497-1687(-)